MKNHSPLEKIITRMNQTYKNWDRNTTPQTMVKDWDLLFSNSRIDANVNYFDIDDLACCWVAPSKIHCSAIVLYVHGGGFRLGSIKSHLKIMSDIASQAGCKVLGFNYRLMPEFIYPAQLNDTLSVYRWLLAQGYKPEQIILAGDSAGGGLVAALLQLIKQEFADTLPMPAATILLSAWLDMTLSGNSYSSREDKDPVHQTKMLKKLASLYAGSETNLTLPTLSPLMGNLNNHPPTLIQAGDCEVGLDDSISYAQKLRQAGVKVDLNIWPDMIHVFQLFGDELPQAREAIREIAAFIQHSIPS